MQHTQFQIYKLTVNIVFWHCQKNDSNADNNVDWANVGPTSVLSSRRWANIGPVYIAVWEWLLITSYWNQYMWFIIHTLIPVLQTMQMKSSVEINLAALLSKQWWKERFLGWVSVWPLRHVCHPHWRWSVFWCVQRMASDTPSPSEDPGKGRTISLTHCGLVI